MSALLELQEVELRYGDSAVVQGLNMHVNAGELACLLGPSGCGKTTVLRAIAGFQDVEAGQIWFDNEVVSAPGRLVPPERRALTMVFQDHALFPHLSVAGNIQFGISRESRSERARATDSLLELVGLNGYGERFPHELSGGQQQRVALARALAPKPKLVLLDEPFANLDVELRERLGNAVREALQATHTAGVLVTHHQEEAFALAERVGVMHEGAIAQWDTAYNLYHEPANRYVASFVGEGVLIDGVLKTRDSVECALGVIHGNRMYPFELGERVDLLVRPDDIQPDLDGPLECVVTSRSFRGTETLYTLCLNDGTNVLSRFPSHMDHALGERVRVRVDAEHLIIFAASESKNAHSRE
jgi:iron(III) transport system ATP-binding protein